MNWETHIRVFRELASIYDQRLWLADQIAEVLQIRARRQPLLIALDDFQFADPLSRFLVRALAGRLADAPVVWAIAQRGSSIEAAAEVSAAALDAQIDVQHFALGPLLGPDVLALATDVVGHRLPPQASKQLHAAGGNPLVATQLAAELASRALDDRSGVAMPASLLSSLRGRTASLTTDTVELLHLLSTWGRPLTLVDAAELLGLSSTLDVLSRARLAAVQSLIVMSDDDIDFHHDLIRDFYYDGMSRSTKVAFHRRCAAFLLDGPDGSAIRAAPHAQACAQLGDTGAPATLWAAAEQCVTTLPHVAASLALSAFALMGRGDPSRHVAGERCAEILVLAQHGADAVRVVDELLRETAEPERQARLQVIAARALWLTGGLTNLIERVDATLAVAGVPVDVFAHLTAAKALALTRVQCATVATDTALHALGMDGGDDPNVVSIAVQALGHATRNQGRFGAARSHFHALRMRFGSRHLPAEIMALHSLDRYDEAQRLLDEALRSGDAHSDALLPDLLIAQQYQQWHLGHLDDAITTAQSLLRLSDELGNHPGMIEGWMLLSIHAVLHKHPDRAAELMLQVGRLGDGDEWTLRPELSLVRGYVAASTGDFASAAALMAPVVKDANQRHHYWPRSQDWPRLLAGVALSARDEVLAAQCVARADMFAQRNPGVATFAGIAAQTRGFVERDVAQLERAVAILAGAPREMLHARARSDLGYTLLDSGHEARGFRELEIALSIYERSNVPLYYEQVHAALERSGSEPRPRRPSRPQFGWDALTDTEYVVAELVARGRTNRATAEEMHLSIHTINTHLRSIFAKLDLHSRVQLANAWNSRPDRDTTVG